VGEEVQGLDYYSVAERCMEFATLKSKPISIYDLLDLED